MRNPLSCVSSPAAAAAAAAVVVIVVAVQIVVVCGIGRHFHICSDGSDT